MLINKYVPGRDRARILSFLERELEKGGGCWLPERFDDLVTRVNALYTAPGAGRLTDYIYIFEDAEGIAACVLPDGDNFCKEKRNPRPLADAR